MEKGCETISYLDAYKAMQCYLEKFYQLTESDDVGSLLGGMEMNKALQTRDPAAWHDWIECVIKVTGPR